MEEKLKKEIPLISKVSFFIEQTKIKIKQLENTKNSLSHDINEMTKQKNSLDLSLKKTFEKEKKAAGYFNWYERLRRELLDNYNINLEDEISLFSSIIDEFKKYGYNPQRILNEFRQIETLEFKKVSIQREIDLNATTKTDLLKQISLLTERLRFSNQAMDTYNQLLSMGFGLELKQLYNNLVEIALANNIKVAEIVSKFLKDVKEQYDDKVGFESKIKEIKQEMERLEDQVPEYKYYLQLQGVVSPILFHLFNNSVTNEDIIGMNRLVLEFKNSDFLSEPFSQNDNRTMDSNNKNSTTEYWNLFIEKLKGLKNINLQINKNLSNLNNLKIQIEKLDNKKQEIERLYLEAVSNLNMILSQTSCIVEVTKQINEAINKKIVTAPRITPIFVNLVYQKDGADDEDRDKKN